MQAVSHKTTQNRQLTDQQRAFVLEYVKDWNCRRAMEAAGYSIKYATHWNTKILDNIGIKEEIDKVRAELARRSEFTREKQLQDLEEAKLLAKELRMPSAMVSAGREQNSMLGYHQDLAPNTEREAAKLKRMDRETRRLAEKLALLLTRKPVHSIAIEGSEAGVEVITNGKDR